MTSDAAAFDDAGDLARPGDGGGDAGVGGDERHARPTPLRVTDSHGNASPEILAETGASQSPDVRNDVVESHRRVQCPGSVDEVLQIAQLMLGDSDYGFWIIVVAQQVHLRPS
jgi:hypothetical protein